MFQTDLFKGRTILITGGGTGLGRSMALRFAELGANIFLVARREEPLKETAEAIRAKGARAAYFSADIRDFSAVEKAVEAAEKEFGERGYAGEQRSRKFYRAHRKTFAERVSMPWWESCCRAHFSARWRWEKNGSKRSSPDMC